MTLLLLLLCLLLGITWSNVGDPKNGKYVDVQPSFDLGDSFEDASLEAWDSTVYSQY